MKESMLRRISALASQNRATRDEMRVGAIQELSQLPGMPNGNRAASFGWTEERMGRWNADFIIAAIDTSDARVIWNVVTRNLPINMASDREIAKMAKVGVEGSAELNNIDYILMNVSRNLWVAPDGAYTKEPSEALVLKRIPALDQFVEACKSNAGDYNVPVRLQDLVACGMGLDE